MTPPAPRHLLLIEWAGVSWFDLQPRLRAGQLPVLARLLGGARATTFPAARAAIWSPVTHGVACESIGDAILLEQRVQADEIAPEVLAFFPADTELRPALAEALADLYSDQNAAVGRFADAAPDASALALRLDLLERVGTIYGRSAFLPEARLVSFRLLDLLLGDLWRHASRERSANLVFRATGHRDRPGLFLFQHSDALALRVDGPLTEDSLPDLFAAHSGPTSSGTGVLAEARASVDAVWRQPHIPPAALLKHAAGPADPSRVHLRAALAADATRLAARFPRVSWRLADAHAFLVFADASEMRLLGAASVSPAGGLAIALADEAAPVAPRLLAAVLDHARRAELHELVTMSEVPLGGVLQSALEAAGFHLSRTVTLWLLPVEGMLRRARRIPAAALAGWTLRPALHGDVEHWMSRPETRGLLAADVEFDPDLSWAAACHGQPAGLVLISRLEKQACLNLLVTAQDLRAAAGGIIPLMARGPQALHLAGFAEVIFTTDDTRHEAAAYARRCGGRVLGQNVRLRAQLASD